MLLCPILPLLINALQILSALKMKYIASTVKTISLYQGEYEPMRHKATQIECLLSVVYTYSAKRKMNIYNLHLY